jgi:hypothetical protein
MPYYFTCPTCNKPNYGYKDPPAGDEYYDNMQCGRCGQKGIKWVASESVANGVGGPRNLIVIGAPQSPIEYKEAEVATGKLEERILPRLAPYASFVAAYSQGGRWSGFTPGAIKVKQGQCEGQCLHWIRRVLQGGRVNYKVATVKDNHVRTDAEISQKEKKQHLVGQLAHIRKKETKDAAFQKRQDEIINVCNDYLRANGVTVQGQNLRFPPDKRPLVEQVLAKCQAAIDQLNVKGFYSYGWKDLAKELDALVARSKASKRPFSNIMSVQCVNRSDEVFASGNAGAFASAVVNHAEFQPGRAVLLSVGLRVGIGEQGGTISGHAIAVYCKSASELYLFDPNLGVFRANSRDNLRRALAVLMGEAWTQDLRWELDGTFGYAVFRAISTPEQARPNERAVDYSSPSPQHTANRNVALSTIPSTPTTRGQASPQRGPRPANNQNTSAPRQGNTQGTQAPRYAPQPPPVTVSRNNPGRGGNVAQLAAKFDKKAA